MVCVNFGHLSTCHTLSNAVKFGVGDEGWEIFMAVLLIFLNILGKCFLIYLWNFLNDFELKNNFRLFTKFHHLKSWTWTTSWKKRHSLVGAGTSWCGAERKNSFLLNFGVIQNNLFVQFEAFLWITFSVKHFYGVYPRLCMWQCQKRTFRRTFIMSF